MGQAFTIAFWASGLFFAVCEYFWPARTPGSKARIAKDLGAAFVALVVINPIVQIIFFRLTNHEFIHRFVDSLPKLSLVPKIVAFYLLSDFSLYVVHRIMHKEFFWRTHRWHHSPPYFYWASGNRSSFFHQIFFLTPVVFITLLKVPNWMIVAVTCEALVRNHWMHANIKVGSRFLEYFIVTPRYHRIHHSARPEHALKNLGSLFSIWDRIFGTYLDPDTVKGDFEFGIPEKRNAISMGIGI